MYARKRCVATAIVLVLWLQATADAARLSPAGLIRLPSNGRGHYTDQVRESKVMDCQDGYVERCIRIGITGIICRCFPKNGVGLTDQAMLATAASPSKIDEERPSPKNSHDQGDSTDQVKESKVTGCLDGCGEMLHHRYNSGTWLLS